jgi:hypothetical protein
VDGKRYVLRLLADGYSVDVRNSHGHGTSGGVRSRTKHQVAASLARYEARWRARRQAELLHQARAGAAAAPGGDQVGDPRLPGPGLAVSGEPRRCRAPLR